LNAGVPGEKIEVIHNGVELPSTTATGEQRAAARQRFGLAEDHFVVGHLGAFTHEKGQDVAIAAANLLRARMPRLRMILAGDNPPAAALDSRIQLPGFLENRGEFFAALDLFIMPSRSEGWGLAAAEAMAHGLPVAASDTGGLPEIVQPGETGWLLAPGDPQALADAIENAASDPARLHGMGAQARARSLCFSSARTAELTEAFYLRLFVPS
jgi:glycogen(starch) synthase